MSVTWPFPTDTACGTISRSPAQTGWAVQQARYWLHWEPYASLTDQDVVWLLAMGWDPRQAPRTGITRRAVR